MRKFLPTAAVVAIALTSASAAPGPLLAQTSDEAAPAAVDYEGFVELAGQLGEYREGRLLSWEDWNARAALPGAIILDTRSEAAFAMGHIEGAVNLPFSDFTEGRLAQIIHDQDRPIYIYCNNNFSENIAPLLLKRVELALNIPTFINLYSYGYTNIWELGETVSAHDVPWTGTVPLPDRSQPVTSE